MPKPAFAAGSAPTGFEEEPTNTAAAAYVAPPAPPVLPVVVSAEPMTLAETDLAPVLETAEERSLFVEEVATQTAAPIALAATAEIELETITAGTRLVVGPVRSGVILEHEGHLIVFGDVNPGAEIRADGQHRRARSAARHRARRHRAGRRLHPRAAARAAAAAHRAHGRARRRQRHARLPKPRSPIARATRIVVERYQGKLPRNLATSI